MLAGDIRRGIERSVLYSATPAYLRLAIVGAKACGKAAEKAVAANKPRPPCDLSSGIVANDRTGTITFHLTRPNPEFVYQLALPNASAVPQDTPDDLPPGTYLPATGPYKVRSLTSEGITEGGLPARHGRLELVRNPHFRVWSPAAQPAGYPDRIVLDTGYTAKQAVAQVADGRADLVFDGVSSANVERLRTRYSPQLHTTPGIYTQYLYLNPATPPFNNVDARRAVAYALDRRALNATLDRSWTVTCQLIPPGFAAYRRYCPFTLPGGADGQWTAPDVNRANALVRKSGTRGAKVVVLSWDGQPRSLVKRTGDVLRGLGYRVSVRRSRNAPEYAMTHRHSWNLGIRAGEPTTLPRRRTSRPSAHVTPTLGASTSRDIATRRSIARSRRRSAAGHRPRVGQRRLEPHRPRGCRCGSGDPVRHQPAAGLRQSPGRQHPRASDHRPAHRPDVGPVGLRCEPGLFSVRKSCPPMRCLTTATCCVHEIRSK